MIIDYDRIENIGEQLCDNYCQFPNLKNQDTLDAICVSCPLNNLVEEVYQFEKTRTRRNT